MSDEGSQDSIDLGSNKNGPYKSVFSRPESQPVHSREEEGSNFVTILDDTDFTYKYSLRTGKATRAEVLEGKLRRKTGSCTVLSLTDAKSRVWRSKFDPAPALHMIYARHPHDPHRYLGVKTFHRVLLNEKYAELSYILNCLGAKSIEWDSYTTNNRLYEAPTYLEPEMTEDSPDLKFYSECDSWKAACKERLQCWSETTNVDLTYEDDFGVSDNIVQQMLRKLGVGADVLDPEQVYSPDWWPTFVQINPLNYFLLS